jgi:flagellar biosynthesis/type III secretory pathway protein FliH
VLSVSVSLVSITQYASANQIAQTRHNTGYNDGYKAAECDFKKCHGHGYDAAIPSGHTSSYDNGYSKGYQDGWNKVSGSTGSTVVANSSTGSSSKQSTHNTTAATTTKNATEPKSEQIPNNSQGCDPTHQFCAMT